jgi:hypothetical protein
LVGLRLRFLPYDARLIFPRRVRLSPLPMLVGSVCGEVMSPARGT